MRTNMVLADQLMVKVLKVGGYKTKKGAIEDALNVLLHVKAQRKLKALRGAVEWEGDLDAMRTDS